MKVIPPFEATLDLPDAQVAADRAQVVNYAAEVDDAPGGTQHLPVGMYEPAVKRFADDTVLLRGYPWSSSNHPPYQRARTQYWTDAIGMNTLAPYTIGQGADSPSLSKRQAEQLSTYSASDVGRVMLEAALGSYEKKYRKVGSIALFGESQFPVVMPWIVEHLPEEAELTHIIMYNPAGTKRIRPFLKIGPQLKSVTKFFDIYRSRNPASLRRMSDTNIARSFMDHPKEHMWSYPKLLAADGMPYLLKDVLQKTGRKPEIHIVSSEHDLNPISANEEAARILGARHTLKRGHDHAYTEYVPAVAKELSQILK